MSAPPLLVGCCCGEVLIEQVWRNRPGVMAVRGPLEPRLLTSLQAVVAHQASRPATPDPEAAIPQFPRHPGTAVGAVRQGKSRSDMRQQHHVVTLAAADAIRPCAEMLHRCCGDIPGQAVFCLRARPAKSNPVGILNTVTLMSRRAARVADHRARQYFAI